MIGISMFPTCKFESGGNKGKKREAREKEEENGGMKREEDYKDNKTQESPVFSSFTR